ncbi:phage holin family protein [Litoreibacter janthinus]|uniref:Putative Holin-X, holin superfamily III n=1 Tax=Litoreibacter janthinus TaxID=670154 RepID=A0A1I6GC43_9RHOB|nr:phage holin family protein [Litoreibacter janthinus]SFR39700.1 Putative Holin-X, holin superfamily III [Litoreibacter janthinus]
MFKTLEYKAKSAARGFALSAFGGLMLAVGVAFLTVAAWIYLTALADTLTAATAIGLTYVGIGFVVMALAGSRKQADESHGTVHAHQQQSSPPLMQAFLQGMQAGATAQRR